MPDEDVSVSTPYPPGPGEDRRSLIDFHVKVDFFGFLTMMNEKYGDFVRIPMDDFDVFLVSRPEIIREVFTNDLEHYKKPAFILSFGLRYGNVQLTDEEWKRRSRVVRPAFHHHRVLESTDTIVACTREMLARWTPGELINVNEQMRNLRVRIAARTTFDVEIEGYGDPEQNERRSGVIPFDEAMGEDFVVTPEEDGPPFARMVRRRSLKGDAKLIDIIRARVEAGDDRGDVLSFLMNATYEDGSPMTVEHITEELVLLFFSAHYTIPLVMTNMWYQLSQQPAIEAKLHEELDRVLAGRAFEAGDLDELHYGNMVVKETVRMFPPAPILYRELIEDAELDGVSLKKGDYVLVYTHLLHFDERNFEDARRFWPERFDPERDREIPKYGYLPFGAGPRVCMGQALSMLEMRIMQAIIAESYRLVPVEGQTLEPKPYLVGGAEQPTLMRVVPRLEH